MRFVRSYGVPKVFNSSPELCNAIEKYIKNRTKEPTQDNRAGSSRTHNINMLVITINGISKSYLKWVDKAGQETVVGSINSVSGIINNDVVTFANKVRQSEKNKRTIWRENEFIMNCKDMFVPIGTNVCTTYIFLLISHSNLSRSKQTLDFGVNIGQLTISKTIIRKSPVTFYYCLKNYFLLELEPNGVRKIE